MPVLDGEGIHIVIRMTDDDVFSCEEYLIYVPSNMSDTTILKKVAEKLKKLRYEKGIYS